MPIPGNPSRDSVRNAPRGRSVKERHAEADAWRFGSRDVFCSGCFAGRKRWRHQQAGESTYPQRRHRVRSRRAKWSGGQSLRDQLEGRRGPASDWRQRCGWFRFVVSRRLKACIRSLSGRSRATRGRKGRRCECGWKQGPRNRRRQSPGLVTRRRRDRIRQPGFPERLADLRHPPPRQWQAPFDSATAPRVRAGLVSKRPPARLLRGAATRSHPRSTWSARTVAAHTGSRRFGAPT